MSVPLNLPFKAPAAKAAYSLPRFRHDTNAAAVPPKPPEPDEKQLPSTVPTTWQAGLKLFATSYAQGFERYFSDLKQKPGMAAGVLGMSATLGAFMAMLPRHQRLIETGFVLGTLAYPLKYAVDYLPQISRLLHDEKTDAPKPDPTSEQPSKKAKHQSPPQEKSLQQSVDELIYQVFHVYLKPITFAVILSELLSLPKTIREAHSPLKAEATSIGRNIFRTIIQKLNISDQFLPIRALDRLYQPLTRLGKHLDVRLLKPLEDIRMIGPILQRLLK